MKKGITPEQINEAFDVCCEDGETDAEEDAIRNILRKKRFDPEEADEAGIQKMLAYLGRKGFRYDTVRHVIQNYKMNA